MATTTTTTITKKTTSSSLLVLFRLCFGGFFCLSKGFVPSFIVNTKRVALLPIKRRYCWSSLTQHAGAPGVAVRARSISRSCCCCCRTRRYHRQQDQEEEEEGTTNTEFHATVDDNNATMNQNNTGTATDYGNSANETDQEPRQHQQQQKDDTATIRNDTDTTTTPRLFHHWTVAMVPPPEDDSSIDDDEVWSLITKARTQFRDPGLYRWPPHANLLYPFLNCYTKKKKGDDEEDDYNEQHHNAEEDRQKEAKRNIHQDSFTVDPDILTKLQVACEKCEPFTIRLNQFGTFGGKNRGVLWLYPDSSHYSTEDAEEAEAIVTGIEPLKELQAHLENQFPMCTDQRKVSGEYNPHMTISHFTDLDAAKAAKVEVESWWPGCNVGGNGDNDNGKSVIEYVLDRIYLLYRKCDDGQFKIVAEIPLGQQQNQTNEGENKNMFPSSVVKVHQPPQPFIHMPETEVDWVYQARMDLKSRRNHRGRGRRRRGRGRRSIASQQEQQNEEANQEQGRD